MWDKSIYIQYVFYIISKNCNIETYIGILQILEKVVK